MKKYLYSLFAICSMAFFAGCTQEEIVSQSTGNEVTVTFKTEVRNDVKSRAIGDDIEQIDLVEFAVYGEDGYLPALYTTAIPRPGDKNNHPDEDDNKMYADIEVVLVKGQTYSFAFWAQTYDKKDADGNLIYESPYKFDPSTARVTVDYQKVKANDKNADAFFGKVIDFTVKGTFEHKVTLTRPFAQVNFLTTDADLQKARNAGFEPAQSKMVIQNAATSLNVLTGEVNGNEEAVFDFANLITDVKTTIKNINKEEIKFGTDQTATNFNYLGTAYFLPTKSTGVSQINASLSVKGNTVKTVDLTADDVNARRNYRTNIYGNLLTSNGKMNIVFAPDFDGDNNEEEKDDPTTQVVKTITEANALFAAGTYTNVTITEAPSTSSNIILPETEDNVTIRFAFGDKADSAGQIVIKYGGTATEQPGNIIINGDAGDLVINTPESTVTLNGSYKNVFSTTDINTLIVPEEVKIEKLWVMQGNVRIEDIASIGEICRDTGNKDAVTYIICEGTLPTEANTDSKIVYVSAEEFDLIDAAAKGGTVRLTSDIVLTRPLVIAATAEMIIDLNGHTISQVKECTDSYSMIENKGTLTIAGNGKLSFKDTSDGGSDDWGSYTIYNYGTLVVANGTIEHLGTSDLTNHDTCIPVQNYQGKVTINGGILSSPEFRSLRDFTAGGEIIINGGTFEGQVWMQGLGNGPSSLVINGGEFSPTEGYDGSSVYITNGTNDVKVSITGGFFNTKIGCADATKLAGCLTGGVFTADAKEKTDEGLLATGYSFEEQEDGTWAVVKDVEAMIGEQGYKTLQAAFDAVQEGEIIVLSNNVTLTETVVLAEGKTAVLDLGGFTLSHAEEATSYAINNRGTLTIKNGTINARGIYNGYDSAENYVTTAKLTIESGTYNAKGTNGGAAVFNYGIVDIKGGTFTSIGSYSLNSQAESQMTIADGVSANNGIYCNGAVVTVNGGNIEGYRSGCHVVYAWNTQLTINGGNFYNHNSGNATIFAAGTTEAMIANGTFGIKDGRVEGDGNTWTSYLLDTDNSAAMTIKNGTFNGGFRVKSGTTMTIEGGSFNDCYGSGYNISGTATVTGGTFTDDAAKTFAESHLAENYGLAENGSVIAVEEETEEETEEGTTEE